MLSRRGFLKRSAALGAVMGLGTPFSYRTLRGANVSSRHLRVADVKRTTVRLQYRPEPQRAMDRELPHWRYSEIFELKLSSGVVGIGETLLYYTWGVSDDSDVKRVLGKNAVDLMWDDSLGSGLQMALFDAVARTAEVPVHRLLGRKVHDVTPLSWWNIDMMKADMASECRTAYEQGYLSYKTKGRPWFDIWEQVKAAVAVVPESFKIDMDFNDTLRDAKRGIPILKDLERYPQIDIYESPIPQGDIPGNKAIRAATRVNIAMHYGNPSPKVVIQEGVCDGFVIGGGASRVLKQGAVAAAADMPFWLQLVGTGITAAYSLHFGAVLSHARWPAVNCHQLYTHSMLKQPLKVEKGVAKVPTTPGLGFDLDRDALERFRVDKPGSRPEPDRLMVISWPSGRRMYVANDGSVNFLLRLGNKEKIPFYERGADTRQVYNDGSARWFSLYKRARKAPVVE